MKPRMKDENGTRGDTGRASVSIVALMLLVGISISCNESSAERSSESAGGARIHDELPADLRPEATTGNASVPSEGTSGIAPHQHQPKHGGIVRSVDVYHVELTQNPMQVWLYDRRGEQFPIDGLEGQIVVYSGDQRHPYTLQFRGDHLAPIEPVDLPDEGSAFVELTLDKQTIDVAYELPLEAEDAG